jgi:hypothetical protein
LSQASKLLRDRVAELVDAENWPAGLEPLLEKPEPDQDQEPDQDAPPLKLEEAEDGSDFDHASWVSSAVDAAAKGKAKVIYHGKRHSSTHKGDRRRVGKRYSRKRSEWEGQELTPLEQADEELEDTGDWEAEVSTPSSPVTKSGSFSPRHTPRQREKHTPRQIERRTPRNRERHSTDAGRGVNWWEEHQLAEIEAEADHSQVERQSRDRRRSDGAWIGRPERPQKLGASTDGIDGAHEGGRRQSRRHKSRGFLTDEADT